jgi:uncharacterized coiled-coil protein SlyX
MGMSPELIGILSVGVALAALVFTSMHRMDKRIDALETRVDKRIDALEARIDKRIDALEARIAALEKGQARLEGLLDGLREALFERASR